MKLKFNQTSGMVEQWFYPYGMPKFFMKDGDELEFSEDLGKKLLTEYPNNLSEVVKEAVPEKPVVEQEEETEIVIEDLPEEVIEDIIPEIVENEAEEIEEELIKETEIIPEKAQIIPSNYFKLKSEAIKNDYDKKLGFHKETLIAFLLEKGYVE